MHCNRKPKNKPCVSEKKWEFIWSLLCVQEKVETIAAQA